MRRDPRDADGNSERALNARRDIERRFANRYANALGECDCLFGIQRGREHDEFIAPKTRSRVAAANLRIDSLSNFAQRKIAGEMPVFVVDLLEAVDVDQQTDETRTLPLRPNKFFAQSRVQITSVMPSGQKVGQSTAHESSAIDRILDGER